MFYANPCRRVVLIYGSGKRALAAANLLSSHETYLVRSGTRDWQEEPSGFRVIGIEDTPIVKPKGLFVVHPHPDQNKIQRLCEINPGIEVVEAKTPLVSKEYSCQLSANAERGVTIFRRYGPLEQGGSLMGGWRIGQLSARVGLLEIAIFDFDEHEARIFLKPGPVGNFRPPFRVADGYIEYSSSAPYELFSGALKDIAKELTKAVKGTTVAEAMGQWYKAAVQASTKVDQV